LKPANKTEKEGKTTREGQKRGNNREEKKEADQSFETGHRRKKRRAGERGRRICSKRSEGEA